MGGGAWTTAAYNTYTTTTKGFANLAAYNAASVAQLYTTSSLAEELNPKHIMRECCNSEEHPNTIPVILALDVTGSMGKTLEAIAKQLHIIIENLYEKIPDVEFCIMGIGDLAYDQAPIQMGQFESDIRIVEQLDKLYFERGGGGNGWESYTAAWYMGLHHTKLDCLKRGGKGIIITMGDEPLNPYLSKTKIAAVTGDTSLETDIDTNDLYKQVIKKFEVFHIGIKDSGNCFFLYEDNITKSFGELLGDHYVVSDCDSLYQTIYNIIESAVDEQKDRKIFNLRNDYPDGVFTIEEEGIGW